MKTNIKIPEWYRLRARASLKKDIIIQLVSEYQKEVKISPKLKYVPSDMDVKDYHDELMKLNLKQLAQIGTIQDVKPKLTLMDRVSKIKKRKALLITIYHKNGSRTHYVCAKHSRIVRINEHTYLCPPNKGNFDNKYGMMSYSYYENNPFPITYADDYRQTDRGVTIPDGELLTKTMDFEFAQKLAHSGMATSVNIAMVFAILGFLCSAVTLVICVKGFNLI